MEESNTQFEKRKRDHIRIALDPRSQTAGQNGLDSVHLIHEALPDLNFKEVDISTSFLFSNAAVELSSPIFVSSMTAGHEKGRAINEALARLSDRRQILMGVGSQRRELDDPQAAEEWAQVRKQAPRARLLGNIGIAQLIRTPMDSIRKLMDSTEALGMFVHLNSLQEILQPEGTPEFKEGLKAIENLVKLSAIPVIVKEVGCGFSEATLKRLAGAGVAAVDVAGKGGTHWGRVEGYRSEENELLFKVAQTFANWGYSTAESVANAKKAGINYQIWASGGVRSGLDVAKLIALGAQKVGMAQPFLEAALRGDEALDNLMNQLELELKTSLFCTGCRTIEELQTKMVVQ